MKKFIALTLSLVMIVGVLAGCGSEKAPEETAAPSLTPEELTALYKEAIEASRPAEENEYVPVISSKNDQDAELLLGVLGLTEEDMAAYGISVSMMNTIAYGIAVVKPAEGKEQAVKDALQAFIDIQVQNFDQYLMDQYEVAKAAKLTTLSDGTVILVMHEDAENVYASIESALTK